MKRRIWLSLVLLVVLPACMAHGYRAGETKLPPSISDVPPSFYGNNPALEDWYTYPYWNPEAVQ